MVAIRLSNLSRLGRNYPIDIDVVIDFSKKFKRKCSIDLNNLNKSKENLEDAKGLLQMVLSSLMSNLHGLDLMRHDDERAVWGKLNMDINRCLGLLDKREQKLITGREERDIGFSQLSAYKNELITAFMIVVVNPLTDAKKEYSKKIEDSKIKNKELAFFYLIYQLMTIACSVIYGQTRVSMSGATGGIAHGGKTSSDWNDLYGKAISKQIENLKNKIENTGDPKQKTELEKLKEDLEEEGYGDYDGEEEEDDDDDDDDDEENDSKDKG